MSSLSDDNESISELCAFSNLFEGISKFCINFLFSCVFKIDSQPPLSQTCICGMCLLYYCSFLSFSAYSSVFLPVTFSLLICLSKDCPWLFASHHFYCFLLFGHFVWWHLHNTSHSLISSTSCLVMEKTLLGLCTAKKETCPAFDKSLYTDYL